MMRRLLKMNKKILTGTQWILMLLVATSILTFPNYFGLTLLTAFALSLLIQYFMVANPGSYYPDTQKDAEKYRKAKEKLRHGMIAFFIVLAFNAGYYLKDFMGWLGEVFG